MVLQDLRLSYPVKRTFRRPLTHQNGRRNACGPRDAYGDDPRDDCDLPDARDRAYARDHVCAIRDDCVCGLRDDHACDSPCVHAYGLRGDRACDHGRVYDRVPRGDHACVLPGDHAYAPRDENDYDPRDDRAYALLRDRVCAHARVYAHVFHRGRVYGPLCDHDRDGDDATLSPYDYDDDGVRYDGDARDDDDVHCDEHACDDDGVHHGAYGPRDVRVSRCVRDRVYVRDYQYVCDRDRDRVYAHDHVHAYVCGLHHVCDSRDAGDRAYGRDSLCGYALRDVGASRCDDDRGGDCPYDRDSRGAGNSQNGYVVSGHDAAMH